MSNKLDKPGTFAKDQKQFMDYVIDTLNIFHP